jgi:hypothetical protein
MTAKPGLSVVGKTTQVITTQETITPEQAQAMLDKNQNNRPLKQASIKRYASAMVEGKWALNGQGIILDGNDNLLDGQHRLHACVRAGVSFTTLVVRGVVREDAFSTMDTGRNRTPADILAMLGSIEYKATATAIRMLISYFRSINNVAGKKDDIEPYEVAAFFEEHPEIEKAAELSGSFGSKLKPILAPSVVIATAYLALTNGHGQNEVKTFFTKLRDGTGLEQGNPIFTLRERMQREAREKRRGDAFMRVMITIRAFNAHVENRQLRQLRVLDAENKLPVMVKA